MLRPRPIHAERDELQRTIGNSGRASSLVDKLRPSHISDISSG